ncbi:hypothetical protein JYU34_002991 [Plutella xylostella]|uniref:Uncharacterized protein n=1 Tax=Plutella xylostella TaxID=51655 RepID=A0ABQ7R3P5_PLUXY|nr:hypothetical protein JYU34_002991 [Plutella xylostella]
MKIKRNPSRAPRPALGAGSLSRGAPAAAAASGCTGFVKASLKLIRLRETVNES